MKLIDLLVQELPKRGGWPEGVERLEQYNDGSLFDGPNYQSDFKFPRVDDFGDDEVTRAQYEAGLAASQKVEWDGKGLPPVGTECEALMPCNTGELWEWRKVKVVVSGIKGAENECLVYDIENTRPSWVDEFRPASSEADKKREIGVIALALAMGDPPFIYGQRMNDGRLVAYGVYELYDKIAAGEVAGIRIE